MYSEALSILDANTVQLMVEEQQQMIENQKKQLVEKDSTIAKLQQELAAMKAQMNTHE